MLKLKSIDDLFDVINKKSCSPSSALLSDYDITINYSTKTIGGSGDVFAEFEFEEPYKLEHCTIRDIVDKIAHDYGLKYQENFDDETNYDYDIHKINPWRLWIFSWDRFGEVIARIGPKKFGVRLNDDNSRKLVNYIFDSYLASQKPETVLLICAD